MNVLGNIVIIDNYTLNNMGDNYLFLYNLIIAFSETAIKLIVSIIIFFFGYIFYIKNIDKNNKKKEIYYLIVFSLLISPLTFAFIEGFLYLYSHVINIENGISGISGETLETWEMFFLRLFIIPFHLCYFSILFFAFNTKKKRTFNIYKYLKALLIIISIHGLYDLLLSLNIIIIPLFIYLIFFFILINSFKEFLGTRLSISPR